jgi:hypothetical protein
MQTGLKKDAYVRLFDRLNLLCTFHMDYTPVSDELHREIIDFAISIAAERRAKKAARQAARERAVEKRAAVAKRRAERLAKRALKNKSNQA